MSTKLISSIRYEIGVQGHSKIDKAESWDFDRCYASHTDHTLQKWFRCLDDEYRLRICLEQENSEMYKQGI